MKRHAGPLNPNIWARTLTLLLLFAAAQAKLPAQTFKTVVSFNGGNGNLPIAPLVQGANGSLYGTTETGGDSGGGNVFQLSPQGAISYSLCPATDCVGLDPIAGLIQATNGALYGAAVAGGSNAGSYGTVFKMSPNGDFTLLHSFDWTDGGSPAALTEAAGGSLYGVTQAGGAFGGGGTVFRITPSGNFTTLHSFCSQSTCPDGAGPAGIVQGADGNFYGTTEQGGNVNCGNPYGCGTVFRITPEGDLTTIYTFCLQSGCPDGSAPLAGLIQASGGDLYGTTGFGGSVSSGGTIFKITTAGTLTTLYAFCSQSQCSDGAKPEAGLLHATDGNFYGTTYSGGLGYGTVFRITPSGVLSTLHSFCQDLHGCAEGENPSAALIEGTNGVLYGTTTSGGNENAAGTVFSLSVGLLPFIETQTTSGKVGASVNILGNNLTGTTGVSFNGTPAVFMVPASSVITTTVPAGATSGKIEVVTPGGTLSSNASFTVLP